MEEVKKSLSEDALAMFLGGNKPSGDESIMDIASKFARQLNGGQIKCLLRLEMLACTCEELGDIAMSKSIKRFCRKYMEYKGYNNSYMYIMNVLQHISLKKFMGEGVKVNIEKAG